MSVYVIDEVTITYFTVSTFIAFLRDVESPYEVKDYVASYLGDTMATREFAESFIQRRNSYLKQQRQQKMKKQEPELKKQVSRTS